MPATGEVRTAVEQQALHRGEVPFPQDRLVDFNSSLSILQKQKTHSRIAQLALVLAGVGVVFLISRCLELLGQRPGVYRTNSSATHSGVRQLAGKDDRCHKLSNRRGIPSGRSVLPARPRPHPEEDHVPLYYRFLGSIPTMQHVGHVTILPLTGPLYALNLPSGNVPPLSIESVAAGPSTLPLRQGHSPTASHLVSLTPQRGSGQVRHQTYMPPLQGSGRGAAGSFRSRPLTEPLNALNFSSGNVPSLSIESVVAGSGPSTLSVPDPGDQKGALWDPDQSLNFESLEDELLRIIKEDDANESTDTEASSSDRECAEATATDGAEGTIKFSVVSDVLLGNINLLYVLAGHGHLPMGIHNPVIRYISQLAIRITAVVDAYCAFIAASGNGASAELFDAGPLVLFEMCLQRTSEILQLLNNWCHSVAYFEKHLQPLHERASWELSRLTEALKVALERHLLSPNNEGAASREDDEDDSADPRGKGNLEATKNDLKKALEKLAQERTAGERIRVRHHKSESWARKLLSQQIRCMYPSQDRHAGSVPEGRIPAVPPIIYQAKQLCNTIISSIASLRIALSAYAAALHDLGAGQSTLSPVLSTKLQKLFVSLMEHFLVEISHHSRFVAGLSSPAFAAGAANALSRLFVVANEVVLVSSRNADAGNEVAASRTSGAVRPKKQDKSKINASLLVSKTEKLLEATQKCNFGRVFGPRVQGAQVASSLVFFDRLVVKFSSLGHALTERPMPQSDMLKIVEGTFGLIGARSRHLDLARRKLDLARPTDDHPDILKGAYRKLKYGWIQSCLHNIELLVNTEAGKMVPEVGVSSDARLGRATERGAHAVRSPPDLKLPLKERSLTVQTLNKYKVALQVELLEQLGQNADGTSREDSELPSLEERWSWVRKEVLRFFSPSADENTVE